jgi:hypothetical protein
MRRLVAMLTLLDRRLPALGEPPGHVGGRLRRDVARRGRLRGRGRWRNPRTAAR